MKEPDPTATDSSNAKKPQRTQAEVRGLRNSIYLAGADGDRLLQDDPCDALIQGGRGQGPLIGPEVQRARKQYFGIKVGEGGLIVLISRAHRKGPVKICLAALSGEAG